MIRAATLATAALTVMSLSAEAREVSCGAGKSLKAQNGDVKATITFTNRTPDKQTIYWIDYDGKRHKYQELEPGEAYDQPTFLTHPWLVTGLRDKCVGFYLADGKKTAVEPGIAPKLKPIVKTPKEEPEPRTKVVTRKPIEEPETVTRDRPVIDDGFPDDDLADNDVVVRRQLDDLDDGDRDRVADRRDDDTAFTRRRLDPPTDDLDDSDSTNGIERDDLAIIETTEPDDRRTAALPGWEDDLARRDRRAIARGHWCAEDGNPTEVVICGTPHLVRLDGELNQLYDALMQELPRRARNKLRRRQREWLARRNSCGRQIQCIREHTRGRMGQLNRRLERVISRRHRRGPEPRYREHRRDRYTGGRFPVHGYSLGGRVREAPGLGERQIANLRDGDQVTILENTGERHRGYEWFKIRFRGRTGYQWGGILCTVRPVPGVYQVCR